MAATNFTPIQLYFSTTASAAPTAANLAQGELAINITDGKLYYEDNGGVVQVIATKGAGTIGGSTTQIQYNNAGALAGNAAMTFNSGTSTTTLTTLNLTNALGAIYGGTAQSAYTQGDFLYASATNTLSKLGIGTVNYILTSTGSVPQWSAPSSIIVQTATNLAGGLAGSVPYQSALDTTTFLAIGAANRVMTSTGSAPQWVTSLTGLTGVSSSSITNTSLTSGRVVISSTAGLESDSANLTFNGTTLSTTGLSNTGFSTLVKTLTLGDSSFNGTAVFAAATPAKLYLGTGTVTDVTSAISATNTTGAIASLAITPIAATNTGVTYTNASTLYIAGAPSAGTNITITNPYSLYVAGGASYFGGAVDFAVTPSYSGGTANGVMFLNGSKQITTGAVLTFDGTTLSSTKFAGALNGTVGATTANTGAFTTLSATGNATLGSVPASNTHTVNGITTVNFDVNGVGKVVLNNQNIGASSSSALVFADTGTERWKWASYRDGTGQIRLSAVGGSDILTISSTGLAVTGTLSSTLDATIQGVTVGRGAGAVATNTAVGASALAGSNSGTGVNTAVGNSALITNSTGYYNTAIGAKHPANYFSALESNTTGNSNIAVGTAALGTNTTGSFNTALGFAALPLNTTASNNTAVGYQAGYSNTTGAFNAFFGRLAGYSNTTANAVTAIGNGAANANTTGANTTAVGSEALLLNTTGAYNTAVGSNALNSNTTASNNTAVGYQAGYSNIVGTQNTFVGKSAGQSNTGSYNTAVGYTALYTNTTGEQNTAISREALYSCTTGSNNTAVGHASLYSLTTGTDNTGFGRASGSSITTGTNNTAVGQQALYLNTTASNNTAVGYQAGYTNSTGANLVAIGYQAGYTSNANNSTYVGYYAGQATTGALNTFVGVNGVGYLVTTGSKNTIIGGFSGNSGGLDIRTASNYIVLSDGDGNPRAYNDASGWIHQGFTTTATYFWSQGVGNAGGLYLGSAGSTNGLISQGSSGAATTTTYIGNAAITAVSDVRLKENIVNTQRNALNILDQLRVVDHTWNDPSDQCENNRNSRGTWMGLIAQEVQPVTPWLVNKPLTDEDKEGNPQYWHMDYGYAVPLLVKAIQEQQAFIKTLTARVAQLESKP